MNRVSGPQPDLRTDRCQRAALNPGGPGLWRARSGEGATQAASSVSSALSTRRNHSPSLGTNIEQHSIGAL
ncbi:hypothetical protein [Lysobacter gummosus]|uniref:hypothetical protein n=1 Tax=Lysobacter gummosus TaxID=262324 RepID=UPI0036329B12